jgi:hypothetical protein
VFLIFRYFPPASIILTLLDLINLILFVYDGLWNSDAVWSCKWEPAFRTSPSNNIWGSFQIIKQHLVQFSSRSCRFLLLRSRYSPPHPILNHSLCSSLNVRDQVSHPCNTTDTIALLYILIFTFYVTYSALVSSQSLCGCIFDLLLPFRNIWTLPHFRRKL